MINPEPTIRNTATPDWLAPSQRDTPMWLRTLYASLPVSAVCVITGGIHDLHPISAGGGLRPDTTVNAIWQVLADAGFDGLLTFDPLNGLEVARTAAPRWTPRKVMDALAAHTNEAMVHNLLRSAADRAEAVTNDPQRAEVSFMGMDAIAEAVAVSGRDRGDDDAAAKGHANDDDPALALVIDYTSQTRDQNTDDDPGLRQLMLASLMLANSHATVHGQLLRFLGPTGPGRHRRPIIWLVDRLDDLPPWLTHGDGIRQISIPAPDVDSRRRIAELLLSREVEPSELADAAKRFAEATEGLSTRGMYEAVQLAQGRGAVAADIEGAVRTYRDGLSENPWQSQRLREELADGEARLQRRVEGQDDAVGRVLHILRRSALGLTGAHQKKTSNAPRGVLYFAGPTGTGKTEMAKAIAELVFADERALIRFDMSEFSDDHAKIRLVGAPPSYVGYGQGGELTNAVQERPQSIVLFDEMDKAGSQVYDLFLQILSDGRLTDGAGRTTSFTETLIVFTSNQGVAGSTSLLKLDMANPDEKAKYDQTIREAVENHFRETLGRPELLGRLGDNIVVFQPIYGQVAVQLANRFANNVLDNVRRQVGNTVTLTPEAREQLIAKITAPEHLKSGGRGITTALETILTNPLSDLLFEATPDAEITITGLSVNPTTGRPALQIAAPN